MSKGQELRYAITSGILDGSKPIYIAKDEFTNLKRTQERLISVLDIEVTFDLLLENYTEFERERLSLSLRWSLFGEEGGRLEVYREMNRCLMNLLSSARLYIEQIPKELDAIYGERSKICGKFIRSRDCQRAFPAYRSMEALRNYAQHRGLPARGVTFELQREDTNPDSLFHVRLRLFAEPNRLKDKKTNKGLEDKDKKVFEELATKADSHGMIDLTPFVCQYIEKLCEVHESLRGLIATDLEIWDQTILSAVNRACARFGEHSEGFTLVAGRLIPTENDHEEYLEKPESEVIFLKYTEWRKALERKNSNLGKLSNRYVTGDAG